MYKRRIKLVATDFVTKEELFSTAEHRISFSVDVNIAQGMSNATVIIYNLSDDETKDLTRADLEPIGDNDATNNRTLNKIRIQLFAGYEDDIDGELSGAQLMIEGFVMNSTTVKKLPSRLTYLYIIAYGSNILINKYESFTVKDSDKFTLQDVITKIGVSAGYDKEAIDFDSVDPVFLGEKTIEHLRGKTFQNDERGMFKVLDELANEFQFSWSIRAKGIGIYPILKDTKIDSHEFGYLQKNGTALVIDPIRVKGTPIAGMATLEIEYALDATLFPGTVIDVGEIQGNSYNDSLPSKGLIDYTAVGKPVFYSDDVARYAVFQKYMLWRVIHKGDTHGDQWSSTLVCKVPSAGYTADGELNVKTK